MRIPKYIRELLDRRERLALSLIDCEVELDRWLEKNGADLSDNDIQDSILSGCLIYCEPTNAKFTVLDYIEDKM